MEPEITPMEKDKLSTNNHQFSVSVLVFGGQIPGCFTYLLRFVEINIVVSPKGHQPSARYGNLTPSKRSTIGPLNAKQGSLFF